MEYGKFIYLSQSDLEKCGVRDWDQAMAVAEATYMEHSKGMYEMPPKPGVHPVTCPGAFLHAMPGYLKESNICGLKWVAVFGHNRPKYGVKALSALMILNDVETGYPLAVMEAGLITAIRTATSSGVSVKYLARKGSKVVGLVGAGEQGDYNMRLIKYLVPGIEEIKIYDRYPEYAQKLCDELSADLGVNAHVVDSFEAALRDSDIFVAAAPITQFPEPVYRKEWVKPGALILPVHSKGWDYELFANNKFIVDDWNQYSSDMFNPKTGYFGRQGFAMFQPHAQLGEVLLGMKPGRESDDEIIIAANMGIALQDISLGTKLYERALELGLGKTLSLE